jgi:hypothetical protein
VSYLYVDIETLPANLTPAEIRALAADSVPANYKDPVKIDAWITENADKAHRRTALDSMSGRILMVAWALDDAPVRSVYLDNPGDPKPALDALYADLDSAGLVWTGHNVAGFDLPFIRHAAIRLRHPIAQRIPFARFSPAVADTMTMWAGTDARPDFVRLGALAAFLGIAGKAGGLDGSKVYDAWLAGEHARIREYGEHDVEIVRDVHRAMIGLPGLCRAEGGPS